MKNNQHLKPSVTNSSSVGNRFASKPENHNSKLKIGQPNDAYEKEADRVADQVVNGSDKSGDSGQKPGPKHIQAKPLLNAPNNQIQRFAFVGGKQVDKAAKQPNATMKAWTADTKIRDYKNMTEFEKHSVGSTDHIGNLDKAESQGTWVRFSETGLNIIGEDHSLVPMEYIMPAVGSTKFTYEAFSNDDFSKLPLTGFVYDQESKDWQKKMGIDTVPDQRKHGGESIFPKVAYALDQFMPLLDPKNTTHFQSGTRPDGSPKYIGQPFQRYFKLGWAWSLDNQHNLNSDPLTLTPNKLALSAVHNDLATDIDPFFSSLKPEGFLGDELAKPANAHLFAPLKKFGAALLIAMYEMLAKDLDSPLPVDEQKKLDPSTGSSMDEKGKVISELRDLNILNSTIAASKAGMRYSGMGFLHLQYIQNNNKMKSNWHPYDMAVVDIKKFEARTKDLKGKAK